MAYDVTWSASTKLPGPRAFQPIVTTAVAIVIASFYAAIIIATRQAIGPKSPSVVVLMLLVGLMQIRFGEIIAVFDLIDSRVEYLACRRDVVERERRDVAE